MLMQEWNILSQLLLLRMIIKKACQSLKLSQQVGRTEANALQKIFCISNILFEQEMTNSVNFLFEFFDASKIKSFIRFNAVHL